MGRTMPLECRHGVTVDWGDFGPCQDCDDHEGEECPNLVDCPECDEQDARWLLRWGLSHRARDERIIRAAFDWMLHGHYVESDWSPDFDAIIAAAEQEPT